jgi:2-polyprenyl-6-methoxyphenol hydroxylase-like FAD-dependent oxidoreductase
MDSDQMVKRMLIIGCGIAGPATALFLKKAGFDPIIYEAERQSDDYAGLFLNFARNGMRILKELDLEGQVRQAGIPMFAMKMVNRKGKLLGQIGKLSGEPQGYTIKRGELHKILRDEVVRQGIPIEFGRKLKGIEQVGQDQVIAQFEDGSSASGALIIGCDGIHSRTRRIMMPDAPEPSYTGLISFGGFLKSSDIPCEYGIQNMVFGKKAFFGYSVRNAEEVYWFGNINYPGTPTRRDLLDIPQMVWRKTLQNLYARDIAPLPEIVNSTGEIGVYPIYDMPPLKQWHRQSVVLLGDAVHATSPNAGQGASLALEDAIVLAQCLRDIPDKRQAFSKFQELRSDRVEKIVKYSRSIGQRKHATNPIQVFIRDLMFTMFLKSANQNALAWVHDYKVNWTDKVTL